MDLFSSTPLRFFTAFVVVFALIGLAAWLVRRFGAGRLSEGVRGRQPRLAVIEAGAVDGRRRLVLIRRDNVEHLLMIGGPTDIVVEQNIVRGQAARDVPATRNAAPAPEPTPRALPAAEPNPWPLQPEPAPAPRVQRPMPLEDATQWTFEPAPAPIPAPPPMPAATPMAAPQRAARPDRGADALSGLAAELSMRANGHGDHAPDHPRTPSFEPLGPAPHAEVPAAAGADQNLVDMAHRLEAALRTPAPEPRPVTPARNANGSARPAGEAPQVRPEPRLSAPPAPSAEDKKAFGSLEEEMASLLGRKG